MVQFDHASAGPVAALLFAAAAAAFAAYRRWRRRKTEMSAPADGAPASPDQLLTRAALLAKITELKRKSEDLERWSRVFQR